jgi:hypothetical protein
MICAGTGVCQCLAIGTSPFASDVTLNGHYTWRVVKLLAYILTDTLELAEQRVESGSYLNSTRGRIAGSAVRLGC